MCEFWSVLRLHGTNFQSSLEVTSLVKELGGKHVISKANRDTMRNFFWEMELMKLFIRIVILRRSWQCVQCGSCIWLHWVKRWVFDLWDSAVNPVGRQESEGIRNPQQISHQHPGDKDRWKDQSDAVSGLCDPGRRSSAGYWTKTGYRENFKGNEIIFCIWWNHVLYFMKQFPIFLLTC